MRSLNGAAAAAGYYILALSVALAAVPFGSIDAASAGTLGLLLSSSLLASLAAPPPNRSTSRLIGVAFLLCASLIAWTVLQVVENHTGLSLSDLWAASAQTHGGLSAPAPLSPGRTQPLYALGYALLPLVTFIAAASFIRDARSFARSAHIVLGVSAAATVAALFQYVLFPGYLLFDEKRHYLGSFTGTFVNPNTAATYFGVLLVLTLALMSRPWSVLGPLAFVRTGRRFTPADHEQARTLLSYAALALVFGVALLLTRSRAGILASAAGIAVLAAGQTFLSLRRTRSFLVASAGSLLAIVGIAVIFGVLGTRWMSRIEAEGFIDEQRLCTYGSTWQAIKEHFFWGTGGGTFQDVFPAYRSQSCGIEGYWEMAHSVPLEGWLAFGFAFLVFAAVAYGTLISTFARGLKERRRYRYVPLASLAILLLVTLHSAVDFSLQIPAVALLVGWALGAGAAISLGRSTEPVEAGFKA
jgi:O-antigen ligase